MRRAERTTPPFSGARRIVKLLFILGGMLTTEAQAQTPARFYWKSLSGASAVPLIVNSISGNTNPFDPSHFVSAGADFDAVLAQAGYARTFTLFDRSAMAAVLVPMGRVSGDVNVAGMVAGQSVSGFGDPMVELNLNVLGPRAQKSLPDALRYAPGLSVDLLADVAVPIGEYNDKQSLNIGQNRWYGRVGLPVVWQIGEWVPGRRTTLELLPAVWLFGTNDNYVGQTLKTDPLFQLDAHLTRDFTDRLWGSLDASWYSGGKTTINHVPGDSLNNLGVGATLGYTINDNINLTMGYKSTIDDKAPQDLRMDGFMMSLVFGWHPLVEGVRRLEGPK